MENEVPEIPQDDVMQLIKSGQACNRKSVAFGSQALEELNQTVRPIGGGPQRVMSVVKEQPIHRLMCYMRMKGKTLQQIADATNYSPHSISNILKQPWAIKFMTDEMREVANGDFMEKFKEEVSNSFETLLEIRDDASNSAKVRADICNSIIDRALGKAVQRTESETRISYADAAEEAKALQSELERLRKECNSGTC